MPATIAYNRHAIVITRALGAIPNKSPPVSEHTAGLTRTTFAAVPRRRAGLAAEAAVILVAQQVVAFASVFRQLALLAKHSRRHPRRSRSGLARAKLTGRPDREQTAHLTSGGNPTMSDHGSNAGQNQPIIDPTGQWRLHGNIRGIAQHTNE
jgi:hypothetical protein